MITKQFFGTLPDGRAVHRYVLQNKNVIAPQSGEGMI